MLAVAAGLTLVAMFAFNDYWTGVAAGISFSVFLGFTVSTGRRILPGQAGFAAAGAFVAGRLATEANATDPGRRHRRLPPVCDHHRPLGTARSGRVRPRHFAFALLREVRLRAVAGAVVRRLYGLRSSLRATRSTCSGRWCYCGRPAHPGSEGPLDACAPGAGQPIRARPSGSTCAAPAAIFAVGSAIAGLGGVLVGIQQGAVGIFDFASSDSWPASW
jgi:ABC-type branched-subunit amino acid transport system permease subunit